MTERPSDPAAAGAFEPAGAQRPVVTVGIDAPAALARKGAWVLTTLLAGCGARAEILFDCGPDDARAASCALAYATRPLPGVPTLPVSPEALELIAARRPLPGGSFVAIDSGDAGPIDATGRAVGPGPTAATGRATAADPTATGLVGAFPVGPGGDGPDAARFAVPFDLVASAFVLLAAWDELTSPVRDAHGRFPYAASTFAAEPLLDIGRPPVDRYADIVRGLVDARLPALGRRPLEPPRWGAGERFALALTHDVDDLRRWILRGLLAGGSDLAAAARAGRLPRGQEVRGHLARLGLAREGLYGTDPYRTIRTLLEGEERRGADSTFFVLPGHSHPNDGLQPEVYRRRVPPLLALLATREREIGLHGNHRDAHDPAALRADRASLADRARVGVAGMRYHYLKCLYHDTLPTLDDAGFGYDTSLAFAEHEGWRCGFSQPFHPYDVARERQLDLVELPLALMDSTLQEPKYRGLSLPEAREATLAIARRLRETGGGSAVLWHHNRFHPQAGHGYGGIYWDLLDWAREGGGALLPAGELVRRWRTRAGETVA